MTKSQYLKENFHQYLREYLKVKQLEKSKNFINDLIQAIQDTIIYTDLNYCEMLEFNPHHGSTCVFVIIIGNLAICCNLGDSIAILVNNDGEKVHLSKDFNPTREKERKRILHKKGYITTHGRLLGNLSISRAFGDWKFKDKENQTLVRKINEFDEYGEYLVSNRAEFRIIEIDPNEDQYIILASDGVFQHSMSDIKVFDIINDSFDIEKSEIDHLPNIPNVVDNIRTDMIKLIYTEDELKGIADNMTCILVHLQNSDY